MKFDFDSKIKRIETSLFGRSVVMVVFQNVFYLKMYQNDFFCFLKIIFDISASK